MRLRIPTLTRHRCTSLLAIVVLVASSGGIAPATAAGAPTRPSGELASRDQAARGGRTVTGHADPAMVAAATRLTQARAASRGPVVRTSVADASQAEFVGNNYYDECGDDDVFDLKKFSIIDNTQETLLYFWGTCPQTTAPTSAGSAIVFFLDDGAKVNMAIMQSTRDASWVVYETNNSDDEADWDVIQEGVGTLERVGPDDGGPRDVGSMDIDAIDADIPQSYFITAATIVGTTTRDVLPEPKMPPIRFPDGCDWFELHGARIESSGLLAQAASTAAAGALGSGVVPRSDGSSFAWGVDDEALEALDRIPGVSARRPVMFTAASDPEPSQWALDQSRLDAAWQTVPRAASRIAILDQGVDATRPDLIGRVGGGFNAMTGQRFAVGHDSALGPHGTAVSGIAVGRRDNDLEIAGVNDGATVVPVRVFDHSSCADDVSIAAGLDWAITQDVDIINMSLGGHGTSDLLEEAIGRAADSGTILIAATGNDDESAPGTPSYPADYPEVIGIGATGPDGVASYSQRAGTEYVAPGGTGSGRRSSDLAVLSEWDRVEFQAGTSFAAPYAAGLVSLWLRDHPGATTADVRRALTAAATDLPGNRDGHGAIDAVALLGAPTGVAAPVPAAPALDGDPTTNHRLDHDTAIDAALAVSALRFPDASLAPVAVLARDDTFADALSGAPLSHDGPLLFTATGQLDVRIRNELQRVLRADATIYLLGGTGAISLTVERQLRDAMPDMTIVRLSGKDRFATSRVIVKETARLHGLASQILLARGVGPANDPNGTAAWADAIAAASYATRQRLPLLIVPTDALTDADIVSIRDATTPTAVVTLLGGTSAIGPAVAASTERIRTTRRVAGANRDATAAKIAGGLWNTPTTGVRQFTLLDLRSDAGWFLGLASAGYAADVKAPVLSVNLDGIPVETAPFLSRCGAPQVDVWVAGSRGQISSATLDATSRLDGQAC